MEAEARGATLGVQIGDDGTLAESAVSMLAVVDANGVLRAPPPERILDSTTWRRCSTLAPMLAMQGLLAGVDTTPVPMSDLLAAREIISMGGGWLEPVLTLLGEDGSPIWTAASQSNGEPGPVFRALDAAAQADLRNPELTDKVPYAS